MKISNLLILLTTVSLFSINCSSTVTESGQPNGPAEIVEEEDNSIYITDRTNKLWEVSHAFFEYGMRPDQFQFGLGPNAIRPLMFPKMLAPGDAGYPNDNEGFRVLGVNLFDDARAYSIALMSRHEIANERFGEREVAVAY